MQISFFSPLFFETGNGYTLSLREKLLNVISCYFTIGHSAVYSIKKPKGSDTCRREVSIIKQPCEPSCSTIVITVLKIISYMTVIIPLLLALAKKLLLCYSYIFTEEKLLSEVLPRRESVKFDEGEEDTKEETEPFVPREDLSGQIRWYFLQMPKLLPTVVAPQDPHLLDEKVLVNALSKVCQEVSTGKCPHNCKIVGFDSEYMSFTIPGVVGLHFKTWRDPFFVPLGPFNMAGSTPKNAHLALEEVVKNTQMLERFIKKSSFSGLYVPKQRVIKVLFSAGKSTLERSFIVEEHFPLYSIQEQALVWKIQDKALRRACQELASLFEQVKEHDLVPEAITPLQKDGKWMLLLPQVMKIKMNITSQKPSLGIVRLIDTLYSEDSIEAVFSEVSETQHEQLQKIADKRICQLKILSDHEKFHNILATQQLPYEHLKPIKIDSMINKLGLDLNANAFTAKGQKMTMKEAINVLIEELNEKIEDKLEEPSGLYAHRFYYHLSENSPLCGLGWDFSKNAVSFKFNDLWVYKILTALSEQKIIFSWFSDKRMPFSGTDFIEIWL